MPWELLGGTKGSLLGKKGEGHLGQGWGHSTCKETEPKGPGMAGLPVWRVKTEDA